MKKVTLIALLIVAFSLYGQQPAGGGGGQPQPGGGGAGGQPGQPAGGGGGAGTVTALSPETIDDFEQAEDWRARSTCPLGDTKVLKIVQRGEIRAADDEQAKPDEGEALSVDQNPDNPNHVLGVKTYFLERGFDRVEISPPHEYVIKGKARQFSVWALGRKFRHTLYIKLRDYKGITHTLPLGRLDYFGWRKLTVTVPGWLPQSTRFSLLDKNLHFVSLFVVSDVHDIGGEFYFYVDALKVLVDRTEATYPGAEIKDNW